MSAEGAELYYRWLLGCLDAIEADVPRIVESAEAAAKPYVEQEAMEICACGDRGVMGELLGRSGGMLRLQGARAADAPAPCLVLFTLADDRLDADVQKAAKLKAAGKIVIAIARSQVLERASQRLEADGEARFDSTADNHAAEHGGLFRPLPAQPQSKAVAEDQWLVPTDPTANVAAAWVWVGEFVAACTRLGKMPPMYQGYAVPGAKERTVRIGRVKFHSQAPQPVPPGRVGREFLLAVRKDMAAVHAAELGNIRRAAEMVLEARDVGKRSWVFAHNHALVRQLPCAHDPGYFPQLNGDWFSVREGVELAPGDFVLCVGFSSLYRGEKFGFFAERARELGVRLAWSITDYNQEEVLAIQPGELFINQHWGYGDAVAPIPGYDVKILPTSGVIAQAVLWMASAEVHNILSARAAR